MEKKESNAAVADASPFFLVEVTGDSEEVDCEWSSEISASMDDDDAESCCCGPLSDDLSNFDVKAEEREVRIKSWLQYEYEQKPKSCVSADSAANEFMNEVEKSKLFWETCLAS